MTETILDRIAKFIAYWTGNDPDLIDDPYFPNEKEVKGETNETEQSV